MRRAFARGRVFPQSYSTDRRYGRLSLKSCALFPLMWANGDDQGRLSADPEEIKYACCPNIDHIAKTDIQGLLEELVENQLIQVYKTSKTAAIQLLDWWDVHKPQWAWPSHYPAPEGWQDHLRYKQDAKTVVTENWPVSGEGTKTPQVSSDSVSGEDNKGSQVSSDSVSGEDSAPSPGADPVKLLKKLTETYRIGWGTIKAGDPTKVIPRPPDAKIDAQLRDLANELSLAGGCPLEYIDQVFKEAAGQQKYHISYVRAILLDWLGRER